VWVVVHHFSRVFYRLLQATFKHTVQTDQNMCTHIGDSPACMHGILLIRLLSPTLDLTQLALLLLLQLLHQDGCMWLPVAAMLRLASRGSTRRWVLGHAATAATAFNRLLDFICIFKGVTCLCLFVATCGGHNKCCPEQFDASTNPPNKQTMLNCLINKWLPLLP
jgi:hypothetical protein